MSNGQTSQFLVANLGSEMTQIFLLLERGDIERMNMAISRAQGILDKILKFPDMKDREPELKKIRLILDDISTEKRKLTVTRDQLSTFFNPIALLAMQSK